MNFLQRTFSGRSNVNRNDHADRRPLEPDRPAVRSFEPRFSPACPDRRAILYRARSAASSAPTSAPGSGERITLPITATPAAPALMTSATRCRRDPADRDDRYRRGAGDAAGRLQLQAPDRSRACSRSHRPARAPHSRSCGSNLFASAALWIEIPISASGPSAARAAAASAPAGRCTPSTPAAGQVRIAMQRQARAEAPREPQAGRGRDRPARPRRQILLAQARPAASGRERGAENVGERRCRLLSIGDEQQRRCDHVPTRPNCGLDGFGIAPLRDASGQPRQAPGFDARRASRPPSAPDRAPSRPRY